MGASVSAGTNNTEKAYEIAPVGVYPARCVHVIELGTHDVEWEGEIKQRQELMIVWELSGELMQDGRPFTVNWRGTKSIGRNSKLRPMLESWRGKPFTTEEASNFSLSKILDVPCMISVGKGVSKAGKEFNKVISVMSMPKGMVCDERFNPLIDFGINDIGTETFDQLWPWVKKIIQESKEGFKYFDSQFQDEPFPA